jgi:hypothetical protein
MRWLFLVLVGCSSQAPIEEAPALEPAAPVLHAPDDCDEGGAIVTEGMPVRAAAPNARSAAKIGPRPRPCARGRLAN